MKRFRLVFRKAGFLSSVICGLVFWFAVLGNAGEQLPGDSRENTKQGETASRTITTEEMNRRYFQGETFSAVAPDDYRIGSEDLLQISVFQIEDFNRTARVTADGLIFLPLLGQVQASGLTPYELGQVIRLRLSEKYVQDPQVSVLVKEYHGEPVTVIGAVKNPGVYQLKQKKTLVHVLSLAGGLAKDAGNEIWVSHDLSPLLMQVAEEKLTARDELPTNTITVKISDLLGPDGSRWDVPIRGGDVIRIPGAQMVYVMGEVQAPGAYVLEHDNQRISVLQLIALARGTTRKASLGSTRIIQAKPDGNREEKQINLAKIFEGKSPDPVLSPNDILFVPSSKVRGALWRTLESAIQVGTGMLIYRPF